MDLKLLKIKESRKGVDLMHEFYIYEGESTRTFCIFTPIDQRIQRQEMQGLQSQGGYV